MSLSRVKKNYTFHYFSSRSFFSLPPVAPPSTSVPSTTTIHYCCLGSDVMSTVPLSLHRVSALVATALHPCVLMRGLLPLPPLHLLPCVAITASLSCYHCARASATASLLGTLPPRRCCYVEAPATAPLLPLRSLHRCCPCVVVVATALPLPLPKRCQLDHLLLPRNIVVVNYWVSISFFLISFNY